MLRKNDASSNSQDVVDVSVVLETFLNEKLASIIGPFSSPSINENQHSLENCNLDIPK
jgi:hypothetical protein